ncbi:MAG: hypothetical protein EOO40_12215, partial [Deltaproteobacteria bacterium]
LCTGCRRSTTRIRLWATTGPTRPTLPLGWPPPVFGIKLLNWKCRILRVANRTKTGMASTVRVSTVIRTGFRSTRLRRWRCSFRRGLSRVRSHCIPMRMWTGKRYFLYFGAINYEAHVYLNGKKLGMHRGGFTPVQFEITGRLAAGGDNFVVVKADNTRHPDAVPTINTDWWNYGGLTRDVFVAEAPATFVVDYKVQLAKNDPNTVAGYVQLSGVGKGGQPVTVRIAEAGLTATVRTDTTGRATFTLPAKKLARWSPQSPRLYAVTVSSGGDEVSDKIGFRTIETRGQDILLNGRSTFLRGISLHDENPLIPGRARGEGDLRMLLTWAKELGCNYVRLAHYPHNEAMLRL